MKLDRNINPDGMGKYMLVHVRGLRALKGEERAQAEEAIKLLSDFGVIRGGGNAKDGTLGEQFFVIKYKDKFAPDALLAYGAAAEMEARNSPVENRSLLEYAREVLAEYEASLNVATRIPD